MIESGKLEIGPVHKYKSFVGGYKNTIDFIRLLSVFEAADLSK